MAIVSKKAFRDPAIQWFPKLRFGMFVHFGIYAPLERGEWAQYRDEIPLMMRPSHYELPYHQTT